MIHVTGSYMDIYTKFAVDKLWYWSCGGIQYMYMYTNTLHFTVLFIKAPRCWILITSKYDPLSCHHYPYFTHHWSGLDPVSHYWKWQKVRVKGYGIDQNQSDTDFVNGPLFFLGETWLNLPFLCSAPLITDHCLHPVHMTLQ